MKEHEILKALTEMPVGFGDEELKRVAKFKKALMKSLADAQAHLRVLAMWANRKGAGEVIPVDSHGPIENLKRFIERNKKTLGAPLDYEKQAGSLAQTYMRGK